MKNKGFIKLWRDITNSEFWLAEPFTRGQAWVDLIALANHRAGHIRISGTLVEIPKGTVGYSERVLAGRWQWSRGKLRRFFKELSAMEKIGHKAVPQNPCVRSLIYIRNYDLYSGDGTTNGTKNIATVPGYGTTENSRKVLDLHKEKEIWTVATVPQNGTLTRRIEKEDIYSPSADKSASPCPHESIIALFHQECPMLPRVRTWTSKRRGNLQARWREDPKRQDLGWWKDFFAYVAKSDFLTGKVQTGDRRPFVADLPWIIEPEHFARILEGRYE